MFLPDAGRYMLKFLQYMGMMSFPYTSVAIGVMLGLAIAFGIKLTFLRSTPMGIHVNVGLIVIGVLIGAFLALCWYLLEGVCRFTLSA